MFLYLTINVHVYILPMSLISSRILNRPISLEPAMTSPAAPPPLVSPGIWYPEAAQRPRPGIDWLWPGYLARGAVTLLTSQWKTGKTTLVSVLIAKMAQGGELAGQTVAP